MFSICLQVGLLENNISSSQGGTNSSPGPNFDSGADMLNEKVKVSISSHSRYWWPSETSPAWWNPFNCVTHSFPYLQIHLQPQPRSEANTGGYKLKPQASWNSVVVVDFCLRREFPCLQLCTCVYSTMPPSVIIRRDHRLGSMLCPQFLIFDANHFEVLCLRAQLIQWTQLRLFPPRLCTPHPLVHDLQTNWISPFYLVWPLNVLKVRWAQQAGGHKDWGSVPPSYYFSPVTCDSGGFGELHLYHGLHCYCVYLLEHMAQQTTFIQDADSLGEKFSNLWVFQSQVITQLSWGS